MSFPPRYQHPSFRPYKKSPGKPELDDQATTADFRAIAKLLHHEFFAEHPDTEIFTQLVKLLLAKIYDERSKRANQPYEFQVLQAGGREESATSLFERISKLYEIAYNRLIDPNSDDSMDPKIFPPERVKSVVKALQAVAITRGGALNGDVIGTFFEEILRSGFKQDKGMYFTHANLVWFMLEGVDLHGLTRKIWKSATHPNNRMPYVIDPSCGSGTFLLRAMKMISSAVRDNKDMLVQTSDEERYFNSHLSDGNPNEWAKDFLYGADPKFVMAITAKVNMVLHGDGSAHVYKWDSLKPLSLAPDGLLEPAPDAKRSVPRTRYSRDLCEEFDLVVSNPPFGITLSPDTAKRVPMEFELGPSVNSESLFIERYMQLLKPKGRLAVVVPESLLNASDYRGSRILLYRFFNIKAVVSLPRNLFVETPTLTSILFAQKKSSAELEQWDTAWSRHTTEVETATANFRSEKRKIVRGGGAVNDLQRVFDSILGQYLPPGAFVKIGGRHSRLLSATLPIDVLTVEEASKYFDDFLKAAAFKSLCVQGVMALMAREFDYAWPTYAVNEVGYKLSKRGERNRLNELSVFLDNFGAPVPNLQTAEGDVKCEIDVDRPSRVLDYMRRDVKWD